MNYAPAPMWLICLSGLLIGLGNPFVDVYPFWVFWVGVAGAAITYPRCWGWIQKRYAQWK